MTTEPASSGYPAALEVDYPDRPLNRLTTFFRAFTIIPIAIVLSAVSGAQQVYSDHTGGNATVIIVGAGGVLVAGPLLMILFREKYPRWWFDWNLELTRFSTRVSAYAALLDDRYPSTDEHQSVHLDLRYPDVPNELNRWLPLVKWLAVIPHYIVLVFLSIAAFVCIVIAWFAILFTGRYPRGLFDFVVGVGRWYLRVGAYAFLLTTDRYPPFSLEP
jgi:ascorbate-specific PTS system EIIC-type component UlaA